MKTLRTLLIATSLTAVGVSGVALAQSSNSQPLDVSQASVSMEQATQIALAEVDGIVSEIELESEHGKLVYEIEVESADGETEVSIDAKSGEIVAVEKDDDGFGWGRNDDDDDDDYRRGGKDRDDKNGAATTVQ